MKRADRTPPKKTFGFRKSEFSDYMDELLEGRSLLIINPVNDKSSSFDSLTDDSTYTLTFNVTHPRVDLSACSGYRRYAYDCDRATYQKTAEGEEFYLILWPGGNVRACFPRSSTDFPPQLAPVLKRDSCYTGVPRSITAELQDMRQWLEAHRQENKSPEQLRHQEAVLAAYRRYESLKNRVILLCIPASFLISMMGLISFAADYHILGWILIVVGICAIPLALIFMKMFKKSLYERFCREAEAADSES